MYIENGFRLIFRIQLWQPRTRYVRGLNYLLKLELQNIYLIINLYFRIPFIHDLLSMACLFELPFPYLLISISGFVKTIFLEFIEVQSMVSFMNVINLLAAFFL